MNFRFSNSECSRQAIFKDASIKFLEILTHIQNQLEMLQRNAAYKTLFKTPRQIEKLKFLSAALKTLFCCHCDKYYEG